MSEIEIFRHPEYYDLGDRFPSGWYWRSEQVLSVGPHKTAEEIVAGIRSMPAWRDEGIIRILNIRPQGEESKRLAIPHDWNGRFV